MKLYHITVYDGETDERQGHWYGTQADWRKALKQFKSDNFDIVLSEPVDVPTDKPGLMKFLNDHGVER